MSADRVIETFEEHFSEQPVAVYFAPGRVNLIGEHTDYNDGFVFPAAISQGVWVAASPAVAPTALISVARGVGVDFDAGSVEPDDVEGWTSYVAGVAWALRQHGFEVPNLHLAIYANLPIGASLSSSAALEVVLAKAWSDLGGIDLDDLELATVGQLAENGFVGVQCGIMDQLASACGRKDSALFIDIRSKSVEPVRLPHWLRIVVCDTRKRRSLRTSEYNDRRQSCEAASAALGVRALRDTSLKSLEQRKHLLGPEVFRRARHVVTENERCVAFKRELEAGNSAEIGRLMKDSHKSLAKDFEVSCAELDAMAESCWERSECIGARMTGAGFGGACVALVQARGIARFVGAVAENYYSRTGTYGRFIKCRASDGVARVGNV